MEPAEQDALDTAFDLPHGSLAASRKLPGRVLVRLVDSEAPTKLLHRRRELRSELPRGVPVPRRGAALRAGAPRGAATARVTGPYDHLGVVAENDPSLTRLLLENGAAQRMEIVHYRGVLA